MVENPRVIDLLWQSKGLSKIFLYMSNKRNTWRHESQIWNLTIMTAQLHFNTNVTSAAILRPVIHSLTV